MCDHSSQGNLVKSGTSQFSAFFTQGLLSWKTRLLPASSPNPPFQLTSSISIQLEQKALLFLPFLPRPGSAGSSWATYRASFTLPSLQRFQFRVFYLSLFDGLSHQNINNHVYHRMLTALPRKHGTWHTLKAQRGREIHSSRQEGPQLVKERYGHFQIIQTRRTQISSVRLFLRSKILHKFY